MLNKINLYRCFLWGILHFCWRNVLFVLSFVGANTSVRPYGASPVERESKCVEEIPRFTQDDKYAIWSMGGLTPPLQITPSPGARSDSAVKYRKIIFFRSFALHLFILPILANELNFYNKPL